MFNHCPLTFVTFTLTLSRDVNSLYYAIMTQYDVIITQDDAMSMLKDVSFNNYVAAPEINISPMSDIVSGSRHNVSVTCNS